jgi:hyperosmotically inducible protein
MRTFTTSKTVTFALLLGTSMIGVYAQTSAPATKPDNSPQAADPQKMSSSDQATTAQIRKAIMADKTLSTYAHNVKITTQDGVVTLKGPVQSDDEAKTIVAKATEVAGSADKVVNQLEVKPAKQ